MNHGKTGLTTCTCHDPARDETLLPGAFADQAALHGLLAKIRDLDLQRVELRRIDHESKT